MKTFQISEHERKIVNDACIVTAYFAGRIYGRLNTDGCQRLVGVDLSFSTDDKILNAEFLNLIDITSPALCERLKLVMPYDEGYFAEMGDSRRSQAPKGKE